jgi:hypothetical protein
MIVRAAGPIDPKEEIPPLTIDMQVPGLLKTASRAPELKVRDIIKIFITTEQANFSHYCLPDLQKFSALNVDGLGSSQDPESEITCSTSKFLGH